ncbi:hypothetical protein CJ030_MR4G020953 [Morella rubra]|uniref:Uncharacterized protein n=1 Tax=Morella rubra TaxID=262757 RepID=A0A6A1W0P4_9ROSI|nr:hypothetical protein CJ030_MR4G020953 [Morella rubra]
MAAAMVRHGLVPPLATKHGNITIRVSFIGLDPRLNHGGLHGPPWLGSASGYKARPVYTEAQAASTRTPRPTQAGLNRSSSCEHENTKVRTNAIVLLHAGIPVFNLIAVVVRVVQGRTGAANGPYFSALLDCRNNRRKNGREFGVVSNG